MEPEPVPTSAIGAAPSGRPSRFFLLGIAAGAIGLALAIAGAPAWREPASRPHESAVKTPPAPPCQRLEHVPPAFVENRGQWDTTAAFVTRKGGSIARFEPDSVVLQREGRAESGAKMGVTVRLAFEGRSPAASLRGEGGSAGVYNFFRGADPSGWRVRVPAYTEIGYADLYAGVDLGFRWEASRLEYDVRLAPGADIGQMVVRCDGIEGLEVDADGSLVLRTAIGELRQKPPSTWYQLPSGETRPTACRYRKLDADRYGFEVPGRDEALALVIDPGLEWSTYLGGSQYDYVETLALSESGAVTVAGETVSPDFPRTAGAYNPNPIGSKDVFVTRLNAAGSALDYSTYLGGSDLDIPSALAFGPAGTVTVAGETRSSDFPTTFGAFDRSFNGDTDGFVVRLSSDGSSLFYSTFLGGSGDDVIRAMCVDGSGNVSVVGDTSSSNYPTSQNAYSTTLTGGRDGFITRLGLNGGSSSDLIFSTLLGGGEDDQADAVCFDDSTGVIVAGRTFSSGFPTTPGAFSRTNGGKGDGFLAHINGTGTVLIYSSLLGGVGNDGIDQLSWLGSGNLIVCGTTWGGGFPTTAGAFSRVQMGDCDVFVSRMQIAGGGASDLVWSTYLGGSRYELPFALATDSSGVVTVAGMTFSNDFPTTSDALDPTRASSRKDSDAFVARLSADGATLLYSTFLGGSLNDSISTLALDGMGAVAAAGDTESIADFPTTPSAFDTTGNGGWDVFVSRIEMPTDVSVLLTPQASSVSPGGVLPYVAEVTNNSVVPRSITAQIDLYLSDESASSGNPLIGPRSRTLNPGVTVRRTVRYRASANATPGPYTIRATVLNGSTLLDASGFVFTILPN